MTYDPINPVVRYVPHRGVDKRKHFEKIRDKKLWAERDRREAQHLEREQHITK